jgi:hypothetical protein
MSILNSTVFQGFSIVTYYSIYFFSGGGGGGGFMMAVGLQSSNCYQINSIE